MGHPAEPIGSDGVRQVVEVVSMPEDPSPHDEAVTAAQEAVGHYRELVATNPDAYLPDLAISLNNLGMLLWGAGRRNEAVTAAQEAVGHYRELAATASTVHLPNLAMSLDNLAADLSGVGRRDEAVTAAQEAVGHYRELAATNPDAHLPDLAMSLNNLGMFLWGAGRRDEALDTAHEIVDQYDELAATNPGVYLPNLAGSLSNLANRLSEAGRPDEAFESRINQLVDELGGHPLALGHLLLVRAKVRQRTQPPEAISDLRTAVDAFSTAGDWLYRGRARQALRARRRTDPDTFDTTCDSGRDPLPLWLVHPEPEPVLVEHLITWLAIRDWTASRTYLVENEVALLSDHAEASLEHLIDTSPDIRELRTHLALLQAARQHGITPAYDALHARLHHDTGSASPPASPSRGSG